MRKLIASAAFCVLFCTGGANAAVTKLDGCTFQNSGGGVTTFIYTGTDAGGEGTLTNSVMLAYVVFPQNSPVSGVTASWNGSAMTAITGASGSPNGSSSLVQLFGILNPAPATNNLVVNWTGTASVTICAVTFNGTNQAAGFANTFKNGTIATNVTAGTAASVAVTSATGNIAAGAVIDDNHSAFVTMGNTPNYTDNASSFANGGTHDVGAPTVSLNASYRGDSFWAFVGVDIAAASTSPLAR